MNRLTTMNDDDYESRLLLYLSFLLQRIIAASSIISTTRRSFFFFLAGTVRKTHICTLSHALNTPLTTHQKAFRVFFFYYCLFCLCFGILYYYYYYHHYSTVQVTLFVLFQFRFVMLSIILLFFVAFIGYPGVKNSRFTKQRPIITKSIPLYGVQKQKTTEYPISPRTTQSAPMHFV